MRRLVALLFALCLCLSLTMGAMAAPYADISALFQYWEEFGYPDDVAGVYSTDGSTYNLTVQLVGDNDGSRAAEIRAMLNDDSEVTFEAGSYSQNHLKSINSEISEFYFFEGSGIHSCGIGWGEEGGFGASGKEMRVVVTAEADRVEEYVSMFSRIYGDAVVVEAGEEPTFTMEEDLTLATELPEAPAENDIHGDLTPEPEEAASSDQADGSNTVVLAILCGVLAIASGGVIFWYLKKK